MYLFLQERPHVNLQKSYHFKTWIDLQPYVSLGLIGSDKMAAFFNSSVLHYTNTDS